MLIRASVAEAFFDGGNAVEIDQLIDTGAPQASEQTGVKIGAGAGFVFVPVNTPAV